MTTAAASLLTIRPAAVCDRDAIYQLRHRVYAQELAQHPVNVQGRLTDALDQANEYIIAERDGVLAGFVSITPPSAGRYSIDKYFTRKDLPLSFDDGLYEVRILTVIPEHRRGPAAAMLMRSAFERVRALGARQVVIIGRREVAGMYRRIGLRPLGFSAQSGAVTYDLMSASIEEIETALISLREMDQRFGGRLEEPKTPHKEQLRSCDHGGAFFAALGDTFASLDRKDDIINADVLDAWFDPAPSVVKAVGDHLSWSLRTSPPTGCEGMLRTIAHVRGLPQECLVAGAGSSALIFLALRAWLTPLSRLLILDPMYGEYAHVLEHVIGCRVDRLALSPDAGFKVNTAELKSAFARGYDLVVLVNPNNPTGKHLASAVMADILESIPSTTRVWIDETYSEYAGPHESVEAIAAASSNVVVCKSFSKVYALSGARAAYLCGPADIIAPLRAMTPPWAVSLPAQMAVVAAMQSHDYYEDCWQQTHALRTSLADHLRALRLTVHEGVINSVLCELPADAPTAADVVQRCRRMGVFIRDCSTISATLRDRWVRVAVKDEAANVRVVRAIADAIRAAITS